MKSESWRRWMAAALLLVTALAAGAKDAGNTLWLGANETKGGDMGRGLLIREQVRQSILIAAREEMGLATRDATLREFDPANPQTTDVQLQVDLRKSLKVEILREGTKVWQGETGLRIGAALHDGLTETCEAWSRNEFVAALTIAGFTPAAQPVGKAADHKGAQVGEDIVALLPRMNVV